MYKYKYKYKAAAVLLPKHRKLPRPCVVLIWAC
jgi:hypothetical protein